jgi:hypothetical protein
MITHDTTTELLHAVSRVLVVAFLLGMALLVVWFGAFMLFGDFIYTTHGAFFKISRAHFDAIHYAGMAFTKIILFVGFLFPYLAIRGVLRTRRG